MICIFTYKSYVSAEEQARFARLKQLRKISAHFDRNDKEIEVIHSAFDQWRTERPWSGGVGGGTDRLLNVLKLPTNQIKSYQKLYLQVVFF